LIRWKREEINQKYLLRILLPLSLSQMFRERNFKDNVILFFLKNFIVQFEEKKFLETAKKIIQGSVANASSKLEND
jgi:hypothetical protein